MITFDEQISVDQHLFEYQLTRVAFRHRTATLHTLRVCIRDSNDQNDEICDKLIWDVYGIRIRIIQYTYMCRKVTYTCSNYIHIRVRDDVDVKFCTYHS